MPLVHLEAKDGKLDQPIEASLLLPSDLLKSMMPEDRECMHSVAGEVERCARGGWRACLIV